MYVSIHPRGFRNEFTIEWRAARVRPYYGYETAFGPVAYEWGLTRAEAISLLREHGYTREGAEQYLREERARSKSHPEG